jgi:hypothetical protein
MIIKNKKNGTNVLAFKEGVQNVRVIIRAGETVNIPHLVEFNQVINKSDFDKQRGWFEIIKEESKKITEVKDSILEKAKKEVNEYASENKKIINNKK